METFKIGTVIAISIIVGLFVFLISARSSIERHYQDCLERISSQTGMEQEATILKLYPEMEIAKANYQKVRSLRTAIENMTGGPAPNVSQEEYQMIQQKRKKIKELQQQNDDIFRSIEITMTDVP